MKEFIDKLISRLEEREVQAYAKMDGGVTYQAYRNAIGIVIELAEEIDKGNISDGYHTFNELYHHRAVLFSVICNSNKKKAWKSKQHDTGDMYEGMFIVGIETPEGQATYHYDINPYWDMFKVKELPKAPKWDGHSPDEAIRRISLLAEEYKIFGNSEQVNVSEMPTGWIPCSERLPSESGKYLVTAKNITGWWILENNVFVCDYAYDTFIFQGWEDNEVIAWCELPAPYTEGE